MKTETKVTFSCAELGDAMRVLSHVLSPVERTLPVLKYLLVSYVQGKRTLCAHGHDLLATYSAHAEAHESGSGAFLFPLDVLKKAVKSCSKKDSITLQDNGETVGMTIHDGSMSIPHTAPAFPADEFPKWRAKELDAADEATIPSEAYRRALECAEGDAESTRHALKGVCLGNETRSPGGKQGYIVGTDGKMLYAAQTNKPFPWDDRIVFPRLLCIKFLPAGEWKVRACAFDSEDVVLWRITAATKSGAEVCVEGKGVNYIYPNWPAVVPKDPYVFATLDASDLAALRQALPILPCKETLRALRMKLRVEEGKVTVGADGVETSFPATVRGTLPFECLYATQYLERIPSYGLSSWSFGEMSMLATHGREMIVLACVRKA